VEESLGKESLVVSEDDMMVGKDRGVEIVDYDGGDDG
jgi:hypothetical protein